MPDLSNTSREDQTRSGPGFNRRNFLKGSSVAVAATAMANAAEEASAQEKKKANVVPAKPSAVKLEINGKSHTVTVEPRVTLLDVLRDDLNLTGAKEVCDASKNCGACTVIIDGKAVYACTKLAHECAGKKITTVEGLSTSDKIDDVVRCFVKHDATQCGFCTPGFVVATKAFVNANPGATLEQIRKGLGGNICRCGTYHGVTHAALECAQKGGK